jgi:xanthine/CO dehydrogenase XdhC/CoxF family maturation factor
MRASVLRSLLDAQRRRQPVALITNLASGEQRLIGAEESADDVLAAALAEGFRFDQSCVVDSEEGEFFVNIHNPPLKLVIIGAVHIAQALIPMAQVAGYNVVVIDPPIWALWARKKHTPNGSNGSKLRGFRPRSKKGFMPPSDWRSGREGPRRSPSPSWPR